MMGLNVNYMSRCPGCGTSYEGTDGRAFMEFVREHGRHGVQSLTRAHCAGCGAIYEGAGGRDWMEFIQEHAGHAARAQYCPNCGEKLPETNQPGTCPRCGATLVRDVKTTVRIKKTKLGRGLFGR